MLTTMAEEARITHEAEQSFTVFIANQQLYRLAMDILWTYETQFTNYMTRISGIHWVMRFIGCIGVLMKNSDALS